MLFSLAASGFMAPHARASVGIRAHVTMQSYADYMAARNGGAPPVAQAPVAPTTGGYAEYMAKRNGQTAEPLVTEPVIEMPEPEMPGPVAAVGGYAEYMASRNQAPETPAVPAAAEDSYYAEYMAKRGAPEAPYDPLQALEDAGVVVPSAAQQLADDASLPAIAPGAYVSFGRADGAWPTGLQGKVAEFDSARGMYLVWLPDAPTGHESERDRPMLYWARRSTMTQL